MSSLNKPSSSLNAGFWPFVGNSVLWALFTAITFYLGFAFAIKKFLRWVCSKITLNGQQLGFDNKAMRLFWPVFFIMVIYFGILSVVMMPTFMVNIQEAQNGSITETTAVATKDFWLYPFAIILEVVMFVVLQNWITKGLFLVNYEGPSGFFGKLIPLCLRYLGYMVGSMVTLGLAFPALFVWFNRWYFKHVKISGQNVAFTASIGAFYMRCLALFGTIVLISIIYFASGASLIMNTTTLSGLALGYALIGTVVCFVLWYLIFILIKWVITQIELEDAPVETVIVEATEVL